MTTMAINVSDERLNELWNGRVSLNKTEWGELCLIVSVILKKGNNKIRLKISGLNYEIDDYIQGFFIEKVLKNFNSEVSDITRNYLLGFFSNFLTDQYRKETIPVEPWEDRSYYKSELVPKNENEDKPRLKLIVPFDQYNEEGELIQRQDEDGDQFDFSPDKIDEILSQFGFSREDLTEKTKQFFDVLEEWQKVVIAHHHCPDAIDGVTLSQLPQRYLQSATYYKVQQLGIIHKTNKLPSDYRLTVIGKWIHSSLGIKIELDNYEMIAIVFRILCVVALSAQDI